MKDERTLTALRNNLKGRIYIYLANEEICQRFLRDAEEEGFRFGNIKPTESGGSNIIALGRSKQLSYVGFVGHVAFQCNGGSHHNGFYRIDYQKFADRAKEYLYKDEPKVFRKEFKGKFYDSVSVVGDNCMAASRYIKNNLEKCETEEEEEVLYTETIGKFNVLVLEE